VRILTIANHLGARGGLERTQLTMCRSLASRGHTVDLVYVEPGDFTEDWRAFARAMIRAERTLPSSRVPLASSLDVLDAIRRVRPLHPDVIYVYRYLDVPMAAALGRLTSAPVVFHLCLPVPQRLPTVVRASLPRVSMTLSVSHDTATLWRNTGLPADGVIVVHTGIDMEHYAPAPAPERGATRASIGIRPDAFVALFAGRVIPEKGVDVLLRAWRTVQSARPDARLVVVGGPTVGADPDEVDRYANALRQLGGPDDVLWLEVRRDVLPLIQMADVAVAPSVWREPFSRSVIEPLACGVPVVATRIGGNPEILNGWLDGLLVEPGDHHELAERLLGLADWRSDDPTLGDRCRQAIVRRLGLDHEVDTVEAALASLARRTALLFPGTQPIG
jgi:glycosyltransferase involved in cell wall biosynthesis